MVLFRWVCFVDALVFVVDLELVDWAKCDSQTIKAKNEIGFRGSLLCCHCIVTCFGVDWMTL